MTKTKTSLYHVVFGPKYRRAVLTYKVAQHCPFIMRDIARQYGITIHEIAIQPDHVHLFIQIPHTMPICKAIQLIKWYSAKTLRREFPHLRRYPHSKHLWQISYWCHTIGGNTATIKKYITDQMQRIDQ